MSELSILVTVVIRTIRLINSNPANVERYCEDIAAMLAKFVTATDSGVGANPCVKYMPCLRSMYHDSVVTVRREITRIDGTDGRLAAVFDPSSELYKAIEIIYVLDLALQGKIVGIEMNRVKYDKCPCWAVYRSKPLAAKPSS